MKCTSAFSLTRPPLWNCLCHGLRLLLCVTGFGLVSTRAAAPIRVLVWDEQQPAQKQAYTNFLGNQIADYLRHQPGLAVTSVRLDDPEQGLSSVVLIETHQYPQLRVQPKYSDRLTPAALFRKPPGSPVEITLTLPNCCFPAYREDGRPSYARVLLPEHPIARQVPREFTLAHTEMYNEPFHVPPPDAVVFEERWEAGEWFRSGSVWNLGRGKVFYFRPGHETHPIFKDATALLILENTVRWMGPGSR